MAAEKHDIYDLVIIGAGPGGYVAAIRAAQLGLSVACVEKDSTLGGTCLNVGCIPSKALLESTWQYHQCRHSMKSHGITLEKISFDLAAMMDRKQKIVNTLTKGLEHLFKKNKIVRLTGTARLREGLRVEVDGKTKTTVEGRAVLIATGSKTAEIPGMRLDGDNIISSTEALSLEEVPARLVVVGAGAIGLELSSVWCRLGAEVTVVEYFDRVLPNMDRTLSKQALRFFKKQGIKFIFNGRIEEVKTVDGSCRIAMEEGEELKADKVLLAAGRKANLDDLGFEEVGGEVDKRGFIKVDSHWQTSVEGIYAIGDVVGGAMLAHEASDEGIACVELLAGGYGHVNYDTIPNIVYTHPEVASVGLTEEHLKAKKTPYKTGNFYFKGNGRALALDDADGLVKIVAHEKTDRILGVHIIGPQAGDLLAEAVAAMEFGASCEDLARTCHAHPTLAEVLREAALSAGEGAIHG